MRSNPSLAEKKLSELFTISSETQTGNNLESCKAASGSRKKGHALNCKKGHFVW